MRLKNDQGGTVENSIVKNKRKIMNRLEKNIIPVSREKFKKEADMKFAPKYFLLNRVFCMIYIYKCVRFHKMRGKLKI